MAVKGVRKDTQAGMLIIPFRLTIVESCRIKLKQQNIAGKRKAARWFNYHLFLGPIPQDKGLNRQVK